MDKIQTWYGWYNNGSGWFEGPYTTQASDYLEAAKNMELDVFNSVLTTDGDYDPNVR